MKEYHDLLRRVLASGEVTEQRAALKSTGERPKTLSVFGAESIVVPLGNGSGFPLLTTKFVHWKSVVAELIWFLRGETNIKFLKENGCTIWDKWADANGDLGPVYGKHWRHWPATADADVQKAVDIAVDLNDGQPVRSLPFGLRYVDQIRDLEESIRAVRDDPNHHAGRRMILSSWNPGDMPDPKVPTGCHTLAQFSVRPPRREGEPKRLACSLYMR